MAFEFITFQDIHRGGYVSFFRSLEVDSWDLRSVIEASTLESKRTLVIPERSLCGFWHGGCRKDTSRKLHINFQVSTLQESLRTPGFSRASTKCHLWSLRGRWWFLGGVLVVFDMVDVSMIHQGSYISIFRSLPAWEVLHIPCVSRSSSWSLRGRWRFLRGVLVVFEMVDDSRINQGSHI